MKSRLGVVKFSKFHQVRKSTTGQQWKNNLNVTKVVSVYINIFSRILRNSIMNSQQQKQKRRIVPQLVTSPAGANKHKIDTLSGPLRVQNLQEESKVAKEILGPGRKVYVNLTPFQQERKQVSWRKLQEEEGVDEFGISKVDGESRRPLDAYLHAITRAMTLVPDDSDSDLDDNVGLVEEGPDGSGSGSDDDGQAQDDDGQNGEKKENDDEDQGGTGVETNIEEEEPAPSRRKKNKNSYDYMDDFIDDSEFIQMVEFTDKRRSKHRGFVIYRGKIERDEADGDSGYEYDEETGTRKKKRQRRIDGDKKRKEETPKKKKIPYVMSDDVKSIIENICSMAGQYEGATSTPQGEESTKKRKMLPVPIREALVRNQNAFQAEIDKFGPSATKGMSEMLFESLGVFTSKQNLSCYVIGRLGSKHRDDVVFNSSKFKAIVSSLKGPSENPEALSTSQDPLVKYIPVATQKKIAKQIKAGLEGEPVDSEKATPFLKSALEYFPQSTMSLESLLKLMEEVEELDQKAAAEKETDKKSSKEDQNKGVAIVEEMGDGLSKLDIDLAVRKAVDHGAKESDIRACLERHKDDEYLIGACKLLAIAGPHGLRIKYMGTTGQKYGIYRSELNIKTVAANITKCFKGVDDIIKIKESNGLYTLKAFPDVVGESVLAQKQDGKVDA